MVRVSEGIEESFWKPGWLAGRDFQGFLIFLARHINTSWDYSVKGKNESNITKLF